MSIRLHLKNWIPPSLTPVQKLMAEEVLDKNSHDHEVTILPNTEGGVLPDTSEMVPIYHRQCNNPAFYYTHVPKSGEKLTATRAKFPDGTRPERGQAFVCGSCHDKLSFVGELSLVKRVGGIIV